MNTYYKLENGVIKSPPKSMILDDGTSILNFELVAHEHGYNKELISEHQPSYNERYQMLRPVYEEIETYILEKWQLVNFMTLEEYKNVRIAELEGVYHQALLGDFQSLGYTFSYDDDAQKNFTKVTALFALKPEKLDTPWNTKSHGIILLTREQYLQVVEAAENHEWFNLGKLWNYKHRVEVAESYDDVDAIIWE